MESRFVRNMARTTGLAAMLMLTNCNGDTNSAPPPVQLFFNMHNFEDCSETTFSVDLDAAGAELARLDDGDVDCSGSPALLATGCVIEFSEFRDGTVLHVSVSGCEIKGESNLASCRFTAGDSEAIEAGTNASCDCAHEPVCYLNGATCSRSPHLCVAAASAPWACEDCSNGVDDDGDGDRDCDDANCIETTFECGGIGGSTITCPSSSTTTTTTSSTMPPIVDTTSTTLPNEAGYLVRFELVAAGGGVGALQWTTDYTNATGEFDGAGAAVKCSNLVSGALFAPNDADNARKLTLGVIALSPIQAPIGLAECEFDSNEPELLANNFEVTIDDATGADGNTVSATIEVTVVTQP